MPIMKHLEARKPCGCVTTACIIDPAERNVSTKWAREYTEAGYHVELVTAGLPRVRVRRPNVEMAKHYAPLEGRIPVDERSGGVEIVAYLLEKFGEKREDGFFVVKVPLSWFEGCFDGEIFAERGHDSENMAFGYRPKE